MRKWIAYSTLLSLFSEHLWLGIGSIHLLYFYFVMALNLVLLVAEGSLWMPSGLWLFFAYLTCSGLVGMALGSDSLTGFSKAYSGILMSAVYFFGFLRYMKFDTEWCMEMYARLAYYACLLGYVMLPFQTIARGRIQSVFLEPGNFCLVCTPAVYYFADKGLETRQWKYAWRVLVMTLALALSASSSGYLGLMMCLYLVGTRYRFGRWLAPAIVLLVGMGVYSSSGYFRLRMDDTLFGLNTNNITQVNQSTFGLVSNVFVTEHAFRDNPILGGGLGSHVVAFDKYIHQVDGYDVLEALGAGGLGRFDASSFALRIVSELGLVGVFSAIWFMVYFYPRKATRSERRMALCVICYVFIKCLRFGNYFNAEVFLFFTIYAVNGMRARHRLRALPPQRLQVAVPAGHPEAAGA